MNLPPTTTAAAPPPPPAAAPPTLPPPHPLPQHPLVVLLGLLPHEGREGVAAPHPARRVGEAAAEALTGIVTRRTGTGGGAAQSDQAAARRTAAIPGSTGVAEVDPETEIEAGPEPETAAVVAETEGGRKRGKGAANAGRAVPVEAASTNKRPQAKIGRGEETGVVA